MNKALVYSVLDHVAERFPGRVAIEHGEQQVAFAELRRQSSRFAAQLRQYGVQRGANVAIVGEPSIPYVTAMLAIAKAGGAFMPLAMDTPPKRLAALFQLAKPVLVLVASERREQLRSLLDHAGMSGATELVALPEAQPDEQVSASLDLEPDADAGAHAEGNAYIVFSSGSTGAPKAILGRHKSLSHFIHWEIGEFGLDENTRVSLLAPPTFDVSLRDIFVPLLCGGTLCIPDEDTRRNPRKLLDWLDRSGITLFHIVPSLFRLLMSELETRERRDALLRSARFALLAGEPLYGSDVATWRRLMGEHVELVNLYGPSESTLAKLFNRLAGQSFGTGSADDGIVPIGRPISNTAALILRDDRLCRIGEVGEIHIKTPFLSNGYLGNPAMTAERFVQNPLVQDKQEIIYKTGDLGCYLPDRSVAIRGRVDLQVKINGILAQPGEIESALAKHEAVVEAAVTAHERPTHEYYLACWYTAKRELTHDALRAHLRAYVPDALMPAYFVHMDEFPRTSSGKLDRKALPAPEDHHQAPVVGRPPETPTEQRLARIWQDVLGLEQIACDREFFAMGGNSLNAIRITARIYREFSVEVTLEEFFANPTIATMAARIGTSGAGPESGLPRAPLAADYALSPAQRRLWIVDRLTGDSKAYHIVGAYELAGSIDAEAMRRAFEDLIARHESLRTVFTERDGEPRQVIRTTPPDYAEIDLRGQRDPEASCHQIVEQLAARPFDLTRDQPFRARWMPLGAQRSALAICLHHIAGDAWSLDVLVRDMRALYSARVAGSPEALPPLSVQYKDYAHWSRSALAAPRTEAARAYWRQKLAAPVAVLELPTDRARPAHHPTQGAGLDWVVSDQLLAAASDFGRQREASLFMVLVAGLDCLLYRYTQQSDIVVGTTIACRNHPDLDNQVGYYVNTLALRNHIARADTFERVVAQVKQTTQEAYHHQEYPFDLLVDELEVPRSVNRSPLFDIGIILHESDLSVSIFEGVQMTPLNIERNTAKFDLLWIFRRSGDGLSCRVEYATELFHPESIARLTEHFQNLLRDALGAPQQPIATFDLLSETERSALLHRAAGPSAIRAGEQHLATLFERVVTQAPTAIAVRHVDGALTYRELDRRANWHAHRLRAHGLAEEEPVAVIADPCTAAVPVALLAILKAGGAYLPIDANHPPQRIRAILTDSGCRIALVTPAVTRDLDLDGIDSLDLTGLDTADAPPVTTRLPDTLAYIIYTSGSTGRPKGVGVPHRAFASMIQHQIEAFDVGPQSRVLQFAALSFDASLSEISMALLVGAELVMRPGRIPLDADEFTGMLERARITHITLPPVFLATLEHRRPTSLVTLITAGERAVADDARAYAQHLSYFNAYGPTECAVCVTMYRGSANAPYLEGVPIGSPVANLEIHVVDNDLMLVPHGSPGELCVSGVGLARGYLGRPGTTAERFVPSPFRPGERLYRTGDIVRYTPAGELVFLGRRDHQLKIRGHRVELGEIESTLESLDEVGSARVLHRGADLAAYYTRKERVSLWPSVAEFFVYDEVLYRAMYLDAARNARYQAAFDRLLPGKTVLEIGPGPQAILSRMCIEAGARKVYAVELLEQTYRAAKQRISELGLDDRIILIHGDISTTELPEKVDYCVSEIVGSIGGSEGAAKIINQARRHLHDPAAMIPARSTTRIAAVSLTDDLFDYSFDPLAGHYVQAIFDQVGHPFDLRLCVRDLPSSCILSSRDVFEDLDYTRPIPLEAVHDIRLTFHAPGRFTGFLVWLTLYPDMQSEIDILSSSGSWLPIYVPVSTVGYTVQAGDILEATISRRLCRNQLNPDFFIAGSLQRQGAEPIEIRCESRHMDSSEPRHPFYEVLFAQGRIPIRQRLSEASLREQLARRLPDYMLPARFVELDAMPVTSSGKVDLQALAAIDPSPASGASDVLTAGEGEAPRNEQEAVLVRAWQELLGRAGVGIHDSFFALGGDSIKVIQLAARLRQHGYRLATADVFRCPTIAQLAGCLSRDDRDIDQSVVTGVVQLTPIQRWFFQKFTGDHGYFNQSVLLRRDRWERAAIEQALRAVYDHHDALRMTFRNTGSAVEQYNAGLEHPLHFEYDDCSDDADAMSRVVERARALNGSADLRHGPLLRAAVFHTRDGDYLFLVCHHLIVDGVSWRILIEDIDHGYQQAFARQPISLPRKSDSLQTWAEKLCAYAAGPTLGAQSEYFRQLIERAPPALAADHPDADDPVRDARKLTVTLEIDATQALLTRTHDAYRTEVNDLLLVTLARALAAWRQRDAVLIHLETHGREPIIDSVDVSRTVGWFTAFHPLVLTLPGGGDIATHIKCIKEDIRQIPAKGIGYGLLQYLAPDELRLHDDSLRPSILFNYLGELDSAASQASAISLAAIDAGPQVDPNAQRFHDIEINASVRNKCLVVVFAYGGRRFDDDSIAALAERYRRELEIVIEHCLTIEAPQFTPSDFTVKDLSIEELDDLFSDS